MIMGINLALSVLEGTASGGSHGGRAEAIDELIRESFWMSDDELSRAYRWAISNGSGEAALLISAVEGERAKRKTIAPVGQRVN